MFRRLVKNIPPNDGKRRFWICQECGVRRENIDKLYYLSCVNCPDIRKYYINHAEKSTDTEVQYAIEYANCLVLYDFARLTGDTVEIRKCESKIARYMNIENTLKLLREYYIYQFNEQSSEIERARLKKYEALSTELKRKRDHVYSVNCKLEYEYMKTSFSLNKELALAQEELKSKEKLTQEQIDELNAKILNINDLLSKAIAKRNNEYFDDVESICQEITNTSITISTIKENIEKLQDYLYIKNRVDCDKFYKELSA